MRLHGNRLDLSGQRYGKLTVLSQADNIGNRKDEENEKKADGLSADFRYAL